MRFALFSLVLAFVPLSSQSFSGWPEEHVHRYVRRQEPSAGYTVANSTGQTSSSPCQDIANAYAESPGSTVPATAAYNCLTSMPFDAKLGVSFIKQLKNYLEFQSTLPFLADPPETSHGIQPVDIMGGLDEICKTAESSGYANHYEFEAAIRVLLWKSHDGHLRWQSKCLEGLFGFVHRFDMIALASSPDAAPKIYGFDEIDDELYFNITHPYNISAISRIDGVPVNEYLSHWVEKNDRSFHDPDARWNSLFVRRSGGRFVLGTFSYYPLYMGDCFKVTFENGTERTVKWEASVAGNFTGITSGDDLVKRCLAPTATSTTSSSSSSTATVSPDPAPTPESVEGYPSPALHVAEDGSASIYNIGKTGIIAIHTFLDDGSDGRTFQNFARTAISTLKSMGIERLIVDVTGNGGGNIVLAYEMFKQLFPDVNPFGGTNMRAHCAAKVFYEVVSDQIANKSLTVAAERSYRTLPFSYVYQDDINGEPYPNWQELYGPIEMHGDTFTNYSRWNLRDKEAFGSSFSVTNGDLRRNSTYQTPWTAENIVIVGDGTCSSACAQFVEAMMDVSVRTFFYGGRPQKGPAQIIGGTEGGLRMPFGFLGSLTAVALANHPEKAAEWSKFLPGPLDIPAYPDMNTAALTVKNSFRSSNLDTPLDFIYDAADYRVQMTKDYQRDISTLWQDVIARVWAGGNGYV